MNRLKNNTLIEQSSLTTPSGLLEAENIEHSVRKIKLKDLLTLSFKCNKNEEWEAQYKMVCKSNLL